MQHHGLHHRTGPLHLFIAQRLQSPDDVRQRRRGPGRRSARWWFGHPGRGVVREELVDGDVVVEEGGSTARRARRPCPRSRSRRVHCCARPGRQGLCGRPSPGRRHRRGSTGRTLGRGRLPLPAGALESSGGFGRAALREAGVRPAGRRTTVQHPPAGGERAVRFALLFRDYLRADEAARDAWGAFKKRLALSVPGLLDYGQIKAPATQLLMAAAERWALDSDWKPASSQAV